jgi:hypothetical protein
MNVNVTAVIVPDRVRRKLADLAAAGWHPSGPLATAVAELDRIDALQPADDDMPALIEAYANPKNTRTDLDVAAGRVAGAGPARNAWGSARGDAAVNAERELFACIDQVIEHLRDSAETAITELTWYAQAGCPDVGALVRHGNTDAATRAATIDAAYEQWQHVKGLRALASPARFPWAVMTCVDQDELPDPVDSPKDLAWLADRINAGGLMWWPTWRQACDQRDAIEQRRTTNFGIELTQPAHRTPFAAA